MQARSLLLHFGAGCAWTLIPLLLKLQDVWAAGVGARSTADKCDAVCLWKAEFDVSSCGAMWNPSVVQEFRSSVLSLLPIPPLFCGSKLICSTKYLKKTTKKKHHYCKKGISSRMKPARLELKLEPDGELLQRQNPKDVMLIMVDYISCIDFLP